MNKLNVYEENNNYNYYSNLYNAPSIDNKNYSSNNCVNFSPCQICEKVELNPIDMNDDLSRLLKIKVNLKNVCVGKEVSIACLIIDKCDKILALKTQTFMVPKNKYKDCNNNPMYEINNNYDCCHNKCKNICRLFEFVLPEHNICSKLNLRVKIISNYTYPC